jgi:hypothetical protein
MSWIYVPFPRRLTIPFIVQGGAYRGTGISREIEKEREGFLALSVGVISSVSRDRQLRQLEYLGGHRPSPVSWSDHLVLPLCVVLCRSGRGGGVRR